MLSSLDAVTDPSYEAVVTAGSLRPAHADVVVMPHRWTAEGVVIEAEFTGAHLYLLAAAGCVLNDVYREAELLGITVDGARVRAVGAFDGTTWVSTGVVYEVNIASNAREDELTKLLDVVDEVA